MVINQCVCGRIFSSRNKIDQDIKSEDNIHKVFEVDQAYRKFIWSYRQAKQNKILSDLMEKIEKVYSNDWLLKYNNNWQKVVDELDVWPTS